MIRTLTLWLIVLTSVYTMAMNPVVGLILLATGIWCYTKACKYSIGTNV